MLVNLPHAISPTITAPQNVILVTYARVLFYFILIFTRSIVVPFVLFILFILFKKEVRTGGKQEIR